MSELSAKMITALTSSIGDVVEAHASTLKGLESRGIVEFRSERVSSGRLVKRAYLTAYGMEVRASHLGMATLTTPSEPKGGTVVIDAPYWASNGPILDQLDSVPSECYYACGNPVVAVWFDSVGNVEGACATHVIEINANGYHSTMLPVVESAPVDMLADAIEHMATPFVGVRQGRPGFTAVEHIHTASCRDIAREVKRFGGAETYDYPGTYTVADLVSVNWADVASDTYGNDVLRTPDAWRDMVEWCSDDMSGLKIMSCAKDIAGGECVAGDVYRNSAGFPAISPRTGVVECTECGEHIMSDDMSIPAQCEGGCDVCTHGNGLDCPMCAETDENAMESVDGPMTGQYDDYDYAGDEVTFAMHDAGDHSRCDGSQGCTDTRTDEDMADTMEAPATVEAHLMITVSDGVTVDLGWHTFTVPVGCEKSIPTLYGERNGEWKNGTADWDSIIRVVESYTE